MGLQRLPIIIGLVLGLSCCTGPHPPATPISRPSPEEAATFAQASNRLGVDLYGKLRSTKPGNLAVSPASIEMALAVPCAGARGQTAQEMAQVLHVAGNPNEFAASAGKVMAWLNVSRGRAVTLRIAAGLFAQEDIELNPAFVKLVEQDFSASVELVDFAEDPDQARETINARVAEQTEEQITDLLAEGSLTVHTNLVLTNAVYFWGQWAFPFAKELTAPMDFYVDGRTPRKVPMMRQKKSFDYAAVDDVTLLALPYQGREMSMLFILPNERNGLEKVERGLTLERIERWSARLTDQLVEVFLPRFEVSSNVQLKKALRALGMQQAFDIQRADFSGITTTRRLYVDDVYHQVYVKVDELGTEAAAATAVVMSAKSYRGPPPSFVADHPFLFAIRDRTSGAVLFLGRVVAPT
jgi:serpin B